MTKLIQLTDAEIDVVAGGRQTVGSIAVQNNINVNPQVAVGVAVLSASAIVNARNNSLNLQGNVAVFGTL